MAKNNGSKPEAATAQSGNKRVSEVSASDTKMSSNLDTRMSSKLDEKGSSNSDVKVSSKLDEKGSSKLDERGSSKLDEKFKDSTSLLKSYKELEREYTKKCQELSKFRKLSERVVSSNDTPPVLAQILAGASSSVDAVNANASEGDEKAIQASKTKVNLQASPEKLQAKSQIEGAEASSNEEAFAEDQTNEKLQNLIDDDKKTVKNDVSFSVFEKSDWKEKVFDFFESHPDSKKFAREIADTLRSDSGISKLDNALEVAYAIAKSKNSKEPESLLEDEKFVADKILTNPRIKSQIIAAYVDENSARKSPPLGGSAGSVMLSGKRKISSLEDARRHLLGLLEK